MSIKVDLGNTLYLCPVYWVNFMNYMEDTYSSYPDSGYTRDDGFSVKFLNNELKKYGCTFNEKKDRFWLDFQNESEYAAFVLIYGE